MDRGCRPATGPMKLEIWWKAKIIALDINEQRLLLCQGKIGRLHCQRIDNPLEQIREFTRRSGRCCFDATGNTQLGRRHAIYIPTAYCYVLVICPMAGSRSAIQYPPQRAYPDAAATPQLKIFTMYGRLLEAASSRWIPTLPTGAVRRNDRAF